MSITKTCLFLSVAGWLCISAIPGSVQAEIEGTIQEVTPVVTAVSEATSGDADSRSDGVDNKKEQTAPADTQKGILGETKPQKELPEKTTKSPPETISGDTMGNITELMLFSDEIFVETATKRRRKLSEVPGSVVIISGETIEKWGIHTLDELLPFIIGFYKSFSDTGVGFRVRGVFAKENKILVMINGRKICDIDSQRMNYSHGFNLNNINQIEIVKGPGSALYGANAYAGIINMITKDGKDIGGLHSKVSVGYQENSDELLQHYLLTYGKKEGDLDYVVSANYWRQFDHDLLNEENPTVFYEGNWADVSVKYKDQLTVRAGYHKQKFPNLFSSSGKSDIKNQQVWLDTAYKLRLDDISSLQIRMIDNYYLQKYKNFDIYAVDRTEINSLDDIPPGVSMIFAFGPPMPVSSAIGGYYITQEKYDEFMDGIMSVTTEEGKTNEFLTELQYDLSWPQNNHLIAGLNFTYDWANLNSYAEQVRDQNYAFYLQDEYSLWKNFLILTGMRLDYNTDYGVNISPRASIIYTPFFGLRVKALYGSAFRAPSFYERYVYTDVGMRDVIGNIDLKPELIEQSEASLEYEMGKTLRAKASYFYTTTSNEIMYSSEFASMYIYTMNMSDVYPSFPPMPGLVYIPWLNYAPTSVGHSNENAIFLHGGELELVVQPIDLVKLEVNYSRFNEYVPDAEDNGDVDVVNGILELNYEDFLFGIFRAHAYRENQLVAEGGGGHGAANYVTIKKWLKTYSASVGVKYAGLSVVISALNIFETGVYYNNSSDDYIRIPRILRLNVEYTLGF